MEKKVRERKTIWKWYNLILIYKMARGGLIEGDIYKELGVSKVTFWKWKAKYKEIPRVLEEAAADRKEAATIRDWIYKQLSPEAKEIWDRINPRSENRLPINEIEQLLVDNGEEMRQRLFLFALCEFDYNPSQAMSVVNVSKKKLDLWLADPNFSELYNEMEWHKDNFFEEGMIRLTNMNNPSVIIYANRTRNAKRGYGNKLTVDHNVSGEISHNSVDLSDVVPYLQASTISDLMDGFRKLEEARNKRVSASSPAALISKQIVEVPSQEVEVKDAG